MQSYEKAPINWPDAVTITTEADTLTFRRIPETNYYRYDGDEGKHPLPPSSFLSIDPPWLATGTQIIVVKPPEAESEANPALREAFQFIILP